MQRDSMTGIRIVLAGLLLCGTVARFEGSFAVADGFVSSSGGYPGSTTANPMAATSAQRPSSDAALLLAGKSVESVPEEKPKKSSWWPGFSKKKSNDADSTYESIPAPDAPSKFKSSKATPKNTPMIGSKKPQDSFDDGQAEVAAAAREKQYSEVDYIASATQPKDTQARNLYNTGMQAESQGRHQEAIQAYNGFIKANEKSTSNGVLASPYHRLALISWREGNVADTDIYFRYALNYALGGNLLIIGGDYAQFLMSKGDYAKAEIILRNALINDPENKRLLLHLGRCVALQKKHQESLRYLVAAVGKAQAYQELAAVYRQQGEFELANVADQKRNEFLASNRPMPPSPPVGYSMGTAPRQEQAMTPPPTTVYPPNSAMGQAAAAAAQQPPYPTLERLPNPYGNSASNGWVPLEQNPQTPQPTPQPALQTTPVSKVFHYPANTPSPVYYQYTGNEYPQATPTAHPWSQPASTVGQPATPAPQAAVPNNVGWNATPSY